MNNYKYNKDLFPIFLLNKLLPNAPLRIFREIATIPHF